jgi:Txe/YoeB family toxin of Txe-Axe toxin-antitoxin module
MVVYTIVYTKKATADIPKLKAARLDKKAKALIEVIRQNPYKKPATV